MSIKGARGNLPIIVIQTDFLKTEFAPLRNLSTSYFWDAKLKKGIWTFPASALKQVEAVLGKPVEFPAEELKTKTITPDSENKGSGDFKILGKTLAWDKDISKERPVDCYVVEWIQNKKTKQSCISFERVRTVWELINSALKTGYAKPSRFFAEKMCERLGITRFNRERSGTFDYYKFAGDPKERNPFWLLLKILQAEGCIHYKGSRLVRKLKDSFDVQIGVLRYVEIEEERPW